jgi:hypothetical protein
LFLAAPAPRLVIDPADSKLTNVPGAVTFSDPGRATNDAGENWRTAATARFVPTDPDDMDAYNRVYSWAFDHFPRFLWLDEAGQVMPSSGYPRAANRLVVQGAKRRLGHMALHTRPREVARSLIAQAAHVVLFQLPAPEDVAYVAGLMSLPRAFLDWHVARLPERGFLWWEVRRRRLIVCPPLRLAAA